MRAFSVRNAACCTAHDIATTATNTLTSILTPITGGPNVISHYVSCYNTSKVRRLRTNDVAHDCIYMLPTLIHILGPSLALPQTWLSVPSNVSDTGGRMNA